MSWKRIEFVHSEHYVRCVTLELKDKPWTLQTNHHTWASKMFLASLLVLMTLLLPPALSGAVVPQYLLDLYRFHTQQYHLVEDPDFSFPVEHVQGANTVRSFHHAVSSDLHSPVEKSDSIHIAFNLSSIPSYENVVSAELRFLRGGTHRVQNLTLSACMPLVATLSPNFSPFTTAG
ncbi:hypothetical protein PHYPO_G00218600 [Pangasianodon hypophthalmus]|uniref:TGF-beta propeptide domain-containing protein n=1 Tax=Pangasianodon hypophthalmus TaxID=310915 RepID=A0A5N5P8H1_PANHP|nr:hypothetical protein PHYPO_G00218600 [Pangasianodon hypophthalmus]